MTFTVTAIALPKGVTNFGPFSVPSGVNKCTIRLPFPAIAWPDTSGVELIEIIIEVSLDSGTTWRTLMGFGICGGLPKINKATGLPYTESSLNNHPIPSPCLIRGHITCQQALTVGASIDVI